MIEPMRHQYRQRVPYIARRWVCQSKWWMRDKWRQFEFAQVENTTKTPLLIHQIEQDILPSKTYAGKVHNLMLAAHHLQKALVLPRQILSLGKTIGNPSARRGFKTSRALVEGRLHPTEGGGLCQISGLVYQLALHTNLEIVERHNHSVDIYTTSTRFTPLGSDATLVYGFKDLRIRNNTPHPFRLQFQFRPRRILAQLYGTHPLSTRTVHYVVTKDKDTRIVHTQTCDGQTIATSHYIVPSHY